MGGAISTLVVRAPLIRIGRSALLGAAVMIAAVALPASAAQATQTFTVSASSSEWIDTGVSIPAGSSAVLTAAGDGTCHAGGSVDCPVGNPNGAGILCADSRVGDLPPGPAGPAFPYGALAAKVGAGGTPFLIGSSKSVAGPGELFLVFNDCNPPSGYSDNPGSYRVNVNVQTPPPAHYRFGFRIAQRNVGLSAGSHGTFLAASQPDTNGFLTLSSVVAKSFSLQWRNNHKKLHLSFRFSGRGSYDLSTHNLALGLQITGTNTPACRGRHSSSALLLMSGSDVELEVCGTTADFKIPSNASDWVLQA